MKYFHLILISFSFLSILSCSKNSGVINNSVVILSPHDVQGKWQITQFADSGIDNTNKFASINIQFNADASLVVTRNDTLINGSWTIQSLTGLDKLSIVVSTSQQPFSNLQQGWYVQSKSPSTLLLYYPDVNAIDTLRLQRT